MTPYNDRVRNRLRAISSVECRTQEPEDPGGKGGIQTVVGIAIVFVAGMNVPAGPVLESTNPLAFAPAFTGYSAATAAFIVGQWLVFRGRDLAADSGGESA